MPNYTCPTYSLQSLSSEEREERFPGATIGCGATFEAEPDDDGNVHCPECGFVFCTLSGVRPEFDPQRFMSFGTELVVGIFLTLIVVFLILAFNH